MVFLLTPRTREFPTDLRPDRDGLVALGGELSPELVTDAYRKGAFPWTGEPPIPWFSPDPRLLLVPSELHISRSLERVLRAGHFTTRFDHDFDAIIRGCAATPRPGQDGTWITANMIATYGDLFARGIVHCVGVYRQGELCGGLYGLTFGRAFFGESMFARERDASKVALTALCERLRALACDFIDCQQVTAHLLSLGARPVARRDYLRRLQSALRHGSSHQRW